MGDIGDTIDVTIPAVGSSGTTYATNINLFLTEVKNRLESLVPRTSLEEGDLDMDGYNIENVAALGFTDAGDEPTTPTNTFQMFDGEIYWVGPSGVVQITDGDALNAGSVAGITGDYGGANPAQFRFVDADQTYYAYDDFGTGTWARLWAVNFDLAAGPTSSVRLRQAFGGGSSYTATWPAAVPASQAVVTMDGSGNLSVAARTITTMVSPGSWSHSMNSTDVGNHGFQAINGTWGGPDATSPTAVSLYIPVTVPVGAIITGYTLYYNKATNGSHTFELRWYKNSNTTTTLLKTDAVSDNAPGADTLPITGQSETVAEGTGYTLRINYTAASNASSDSFTGLSLTYTTLL